jgi:hypothetical protein
MFQMPLGPWQAAVGMVAGPRAAAGAAVASVAVASAAVASAAVASAARQLGPTEAEASLLRWGVSDKRAYSIQQIHVHNKPTDGVSESSRIRNKVVFSQAGLVIILLQLVMHRSEIWSEI